MHGLVGSQDTVTAAQPLIEKTLCRVEHFGRPLKPLRVTPVSATQRSTAASIGQRTTGHRDGGLQTKGLGRATAPGAQSARGFHAAPQLEKGGRSQFHRISFKTRLRGD